MNRQQLEHILRASAAITGADEFIVIGSQSILGPFPDAPPDLLDSIEADLYSLRSRDDANLIDGTIGEGSAFHQTFGYYAHGVAEETANLPDGWKDRLIPVRGPDTNGATGLRLDAHDLAVSKLIAGGEADAAFVSVMLRHQLADPDLLRSRLATTRVESAVRAAAEARLARLAAESDRRPDP
ncbi:MAG: hypothetical protein IPJ41_06510 [Phycisphaerales bacterium]|nr:hypothetical protein [Phycisphaerales bacterium]